MDNLGNLKSQAGPTDETLETWQHFLESVPPGETRQVRDALRFNLGRQVWELLLPKLLLHCSSQTCGGERTFSCDTDAETLPRDLSVLVKIITYECRNCRGTQKIFAVSIRRLEGNIERTLAAANKIGESPTFGPKVSRRVLDLLGDDKELFLKGRRAENQGMGIGAFVYYRRVLEGQRARLLGQIAEVARRIGAPQDLIAKIDHAKDHWQFTRTIDEIKDIIPAQLLINGHNPLVLLHSALSHGVHGATDERCLELAASIRIVLAELAERIAQALKDEAELQRAISSLLQAKAPAV